MTDVVFATNCSDLILMTANLEMWPTFATKLEDFAFYRDCFVYFKILFIS